MNSQDPNPCRIIGVLDDGAASLSATALAYIRNADVLIGGTRTLALLAHHARDTAVQHDLTGALAQVPGWIAQAREADQSCVVLATGLAGAAAVHRVAGDPAQPEHAATGLRPHRPGLAGGEDRLGARQGCR